MNLDREDEKLEAYLKQFKARAPRPLPVAEKPFPRRTLMAMSAVATIIVLILAIIVLRGGQTRTEKPVEVQVQKEPVPQQISMMRLNRFAREDPEKLGSHLDELSVRLLPDVNGSKGVLKQLARE